MSRAFPNTPQSDVIVDSARLDLIKYESSGQWSFAKNFNADVAYQGTFTTSSIAGDTATFTFNGTQIGVWAYMPGSATAADFGTPTVTRYTIDGSDPITHQSQFLSSRPVTGMYEQVFQSNILSSGIHVLQVTVTQPGKLLYHLDWVEYNSTVTSEGSNSNGNSGSNSNGDSGSNPNGNSGSNSNGTNGSNSNGNNGQDQNQNQNGSSDPDGNNGENQNNGNSNGSNTTGGSNNGMLPSQTANGSNPQESLPSSSASAKPVPVSTIAGGAAAGVVLIIGIAVLAFWIGRTRRRRRQLGDITHDEATLFKEQANSDQPYADDDAPAYLTHQRPGTGPQKTKSTPSSSAYTHSDTFTAYDAPQSITPYATSLQAHAVVVPPTHMPAHIPMAAAHPLPPPAPPVSDYGIASVTGTTVSSSRSDGSSAGIRYRTAQEEKALVYLSESGISRGGQSLSGERVTGTSGPAGSSSNLPATGEAPPPAYIP